MKKLIPVTLLLLVSLSHGIMERGDYPWGTKLRSWHDDAMNKDLGTTPWLLNLGPTGIRARIYPDKPRHLVVKYVFQDPKSPAREKVFIEDVIVGANGKKFSTDHRFGRNLPGGGGWDGPMMELAHHIEDSQGGDGVLKLIVWPQGISHKETEVAVHLEPVGRFAPTFPYQCARSEKMLEELCDFMVEEYKNSNWKSGNSFGGGTHGQSHQILALMASGMSKYDRLIDENVSRLHGKSYNPEGGGFQTWRWGYEGIIMGEYYRLHKDRKLLPVIESLTAAMPLGSKNGNGIYTHRSHLNIVQSGKKPYASIAAISGLQMVAMSLFDELGLGYDTALRQRIHQHYLNSATDSALNIAYAFKNADRFNDPDLGHRHAVLTLADPKKAESGKGPGYIIPGGMSAIGEYEIFWPTKKDPRWKPTDWVSREADTNIVSQLGKPGQVVVDRNNPKYREAPEPSKPYKTTGTGGHLAPVGMGAVAHLIGANNPESWKYLGHHAANTCVNGPGNLFDGHASSNLSAFWAILGAAMSDQPDKVREYLDYQKTFLILSETHDGGLILQPWGRDRPGSNSDASYGPRILSTATGAILLSLGKRHLRITGAGMGEAVATALPKNRLAPRPQARPARKLAQGTQGLISEMLFTSLIEISQSGELEKVPMSLSKANGKVWLAKVEPGGQLTFQALQGDKQATFNYTDLTPEDSSMIARLVAHYQPDNQAAQVTAGIFTEILGDTTTADQYYEKAGKEFGEKLNELFEDE